jgi:hypothetical protein
MANVCNYYLKRNKAIEEGNFFKITFENFIPTSEGIRAGVAHFV